MSAFGPEVDAAPDESAYRGVANGNGHEGEPRNVSTVRLEFLVLAHAMYAADEVAFREDLTRELFTSTRTLKLFDLCVRWYSSKNESLNGPVLEAQLLADGLSTQDAAKLCARIDVSWVETAGHNPRLLLSELQRHQRARRVSRLLEQARVALSGSEPDAAQARACLDRAAELETQAAPAPATKPGIAVVGVVQRWLTEGPLRRIATGIPVLDRMCRGGLPVPWRVQLVGAPSAGKTAVAIVVAYHFACAAGEAGACVGILAVDEDPDDVTVRIAQIAGFSVAEAEAREPAVLEAMARELADLRIRLYTHEHSIESASKDLAAWAKAEGRPAVLVIDSLQTAVPDSAGPRLTAREHVEANVRAMRQAADGLRMIVISTSEANRAAYRDLSNPQNDIAAGAESRAIEFSAQTQLVLRTPPDHPDVIHVKVAKNRRARKGEFWLTLDREKHTLAECENPSPKESSENKRSRAEVNLEEDAIKLSKLVALHSGLTVRELREWAAKDLDWGHSRFDKARSRLEPGVAGWRLVNTGSKGAQKLVLEPFTESEES